MNGIKKSALFISLAGCFLGLILSACSDADLEPPHVLGTVEVPPQILSEPRLVATPAGSTLSSPEWPRLGDVPSKPTDFSPQTTIDQTRQQMERDRTEARALEWKYENPQVMSPAVIPQQGSPN